MMSDNDLDYSSQTTIPDGYIFDRQEIFFDEEHLKLVKEAERQLKAYDDHLMQSIKGRYNLNDSIDMQKMFLEDSGRKFFINILSELYSKFAKTIIILRKC